MSDQLFNFRVWGWERYSGEAPDAQPVFEATVRARDIQHARQLAECRYWQLPADQHTKDVINFVTTGELPERKCLCRWRVEKCG